MSKTLKWFWMLLIWLIFCFIGFHACVKDECVNCQKIETEEEVAPVPPPVETEARFPIDFQWDNAKAFINDGYDARRNQLISEMGEDNTLVITGKYYSSESAPEGYTSMGMARATQIRDLLVPDIPNDRIILSDLKLDDSEDAKTGYFQAIDFDWETKDVEQEIEIIEVDDNITINFPNGSAQKVDDAKVDAYLDKLAQRLSQTNETVQITGHTDNTGSRDGNMRLSERRAKSIRDLLVGKGVDAKRFTVAWKGQDSPVSTNETEQGRYNNRRVELRIQAGN
jgi:outer membrane protein OmpA-like peptidoglycan-associated protein